MWKLATLYLLAIAVILAYRLANAPWQSQVSIGNHTWMISLPPAPAWSSPSGSSPEAFYELYPDIPSAAVESAGVQTHWRSDWTAIECVLLAWPTSLVFGLIYFATRKQARNLILYCAWTVGLSMTACAAASVALWTVFGGWSAPFPLFFGGLGLLVGLIIGAATFQRAPA